MTSGAAVVKLRLAGRITPTLLREPSGKCRVWLTQRPVEMDVGRLDHADRIEALAHGFALGFAHGVVPAAGGTL